MTAIRDGLLLIQAVSVTNAHRTDDRGGSKPVNGRQLKLFLAGDVMTGRGIDQILPHPSEPSLHESFVKDARRYVALAERENGAIPKPVDFSYIWGDALDVWSVERPDLRIVNLETSITTSDAFWPAKGIHYRMHPANVPCLSAAGIDCCVLANNHVMDWGRAGMTETLETLEEAGLSTVGAGRSLEEATRPARFSVADKGDVIVFAFADASSGVPDSWRARADQSGIRLLDDLSARSGEQVAADIATRSRPDDVVVASVHWGGNWGYDVPADQRAFAHRLIDSGGVDIVHGHSSHHAKPIELYNGKPIIYGCGDFVTDYEGIGGYDHFRPWIAPMYFVSLSVESRRLERLEIMPLYLRRFQLARASRDDRYWLGRNLNRISAEFGARFDTTGDGLLASPYAVIQRGNRHE